MTRQPIAPPFYYGWVIEAMQTKTFWRILGCTAVPSMVKTGITFHLVSILGQAGLSYITTSFILGLIPLVGFPVTFVAGFLLEKVAVRYVYSISFLFQALLLISLLRVDSLMLAVVFGVVWGICDGFQNICQGMIWPSYFGRRNLGSITGVVMATMVVGSAFGPLPFGMAFDWFGGYNQILIVMALFPLLAALAAWVSPIPRKEK